MSNAFESIKQGMEQAIQHASGSKAGITLTDVEANAKGGGDDLLAPSLVDMDEYIDRFKEWLVL